MNRPYNKQARKWANEITESRQTNIRPDAFAAAKIIQSLPDTVVDGDKLRELVEKADEGHYSAGSFLRRVKELLPAPSLPTLAELIEAGNDPKQYQWMACEVKEPDSAPSKGHITFLSGGFSYVLFPSGISGAFADNHIAPRPDLPRLECPGSVPENVPGEECQFMHPPECYCGDVSDQQEDSSESPKISLPRPEAVPPGGAWLIKVNGKEKEAIKTKHPNFPWSVSGKPAFEGRNAYSNEGVTLISRLVPKTR